MRTQQLNNQKGEIEFRRKLYLQQVEHQVMIPDEFDSAGIEGILKGRMEKTRAQMSLLRDRGAILSPYLEVGAERCQRSLVMENDMGANGAAVDISYEMLKSGSYYQDVFHKSKLPLRVCCDVYNLPFKTNSVPFIFCYETLHHFPDPGPIVDEIYRVLAPGGGFFFDEEPYKQILHLDLYQEKVTAAAPAVSKSHLRQTLDFYFRQAVYNEVEHGIIENHRIPLDVWKRALARFEKKEIALISSKSLQADLYRPGSCLRYFLAELQGGFIGGLSQKTGVPVSSATTIREILICPTCKESGSEETLREESSGFVCSQCRKAYLAKEGVVFLLSYSKLEALYPEIFGELRLANLS